MQRLGTQRLANALRVPEPAAIDALHCRHSASCDPNTQACFNPTQAIFVPRAFCKLAYALRQQSPLVANALLSKRSASCESPPLCLLKHKP